MTKREVYRRGVQKWRKEGRSDAAIAGMTYAEFTPILRRQSMTVSHYSSLRAEFRRELESATEKSEKSQWLQALEAPMKLSELLARVFDTMDQEGYSEISLSSKGGKRKVVVEEKPRIHELDID